MKKRIREQDIYYFDSGEQEDTGLCAGMLRQMIGEIMRRENRRGVLLFCIGKTCRRPRHGTDTADRP